MRLEIVRPLELAAADVSAWRALQAAQPALDSPYLSPDWPLALAAAGGPDAARGRVLVAREGGESVGFMAARVGRFTAGPCGAPLCDVQGPVLRPGLRLDPAAVARAFGVGRLDLFNLAEPDGSFARFVRGTAETLRIDVSGGFDAYAAARRAAGSDILQDAAKKRRKLEREHGPVTFTALSASAADLEALIDWKRAQYRATGQTDIFEAGWPLTLLRQLNASTDLAFGGRLFTLHAGGEMIAAHYALQGGRVLHAWFIAHAETHARYSPGVLLIADILRWAEGAGIAAMDLGPGDYRFKQSLANVRTPLGHGFVGRAHPASAVRGAAYALRAAAEARDLGRWSALPGKAMRRIDLVRSLRG